MFVRKIGLEDVRCFELEVRVAQFYRGELRGQRKRIMSLQAEMKYFPLSINEFTIFRPRENVLGYIIMGGQLRH